MTLEQIALICRVRTLDTLDLQGNDFAKSAEDKQAVWSQLAQLPELKRLSLGSSMLEGLQIPQGPRHLENLKTLIFNYCKRWPADFKEQLENAYPGVDVIVDNKGSDTACDWFDPLKADPAEADLW